MFSGESAFATFIADAFAVFIFILWFWLFITAASDLFRRRDISGFGKVLWVILLIVLPYIGIFAYILSQGGGMAAVRRILGAKRACLEEIARLEAAQGVVRANAAGGPDAWSPSDQARVHVARARIATLVEEILACEERNDRELLDQAQLV